MLVWCGIVIHVIFLLSVFDIYFKSPVINDVAVYIPEGKYPSSRIVLFSADGLRAESLFRSTNVPYLKSVISQKAIWGISHTRVPTESRPGHVAFIAGFYEDPSAIAKGWKENPVEFDSLFNRSAHTWSWGSPDILPMFAKGATGNHIDTFYYSHEEEDFSGKISTANLDIWVFDRVKLFLEKAKNDENLLQLLKKDKLIFFLHLLGLDTAGHTHKPHSREYEENLKIVDEGVKKTVQLFEEFYDHDSRTTFLFTADHGMTDWGSHGAGDNHETQTPLIVWGAGVSAPPVPTLLDNEFSFMSSTLREDVNQADICPLIASFLGIPIPVNSVGVIPGSYFKSNIELKARGFHSNAKQLLFQYDRKRETVEDYAVKKIFKPFSKLTKAKVQFLSDEIDSLLKNMDYEKVITVSNETIYLCLEGLDYYQNYYQEFLLFCMSLSFISWILWLLTVLLQGYVLNKKLNKSPIKHLYAHSKKLNATIHIVFGTMLIGMLTLINVQNLPIQYNIYCCLPIVLWWNRFLSWKLWYNFLLPTSRSSLMSNLRMLFIAILYIAGTSILVSIFFYRWMLSVCLVALLLIQLYSCFGKNIPFLLLILWVLSCIGLAVFSFLPVVGKIENVHMVGASGVLWFIGSLFYLFNISLKLLKNGQETKRQNIMLVIPLLLILAALQNKYYIYFMFISKKGLSWVNQIISWILAVLSFVVPMQSSHWIMSRLFCIMTSFAVFFLLLSVSHEGFFLFVLASSLLCWLAMEHYRSHTNQDTRLTLWSFKSSDKQNTINPIHRSLNQDDFRRSFFFLFYIILSFFGTGNIASVNSFDPRWVQCFISQFSPFIMGGLILCKTMVPFLYVACTFCAINLVVKAPTGHLILIVLIFSDLMGLHFLHMVTNKGSWLDIGTSISHYVIMETTVLFVSILYGLGLVLTGISKLTLSNIFGKNEKVC